MSFSFVELEPFSRLFYMLGLQGNYTHKGLSLDINDLTKIIGNDTGRNNLQNHRKFSWRG